MVVKGYWVKLRVLAFNQNKPTRLVTLKNECWALCQRFPQTLRITIAISVCKLLFHQLNLHLVYEWPVLNDAEMNCGVEVLES